MFLNDAVNIIPINNNEKYNVSNFSFFHEPFIKKENNSYIVTKRRFFQFQKKLLNKKIIRPNNSMFSRIKYFLFNRSNIYYSDLPYGYLSIFKHADNVFSDRVHSCAATLILGGKAMYIKGSKRSCDGRNNLFKRIKAESIYKMPTSLNFQYINKEKKKMISALERLV
jgi:hypothetical protein